MLCKELIFVFILDTEKQFSDENAKHVMLFFTHFLTSLIKIRDYKNWQRWQVICNSFPIFHEDSCLNKNKSICFKGNRIFRCSIFYDMTLIESKTLTRERNQNQNTHKWRHKRKKKKKTIYVVMSVAPKTYLSEFPAITYC